MNKSFFSFFSAAALSLTSLSINLTYAAEKNEYVFALRKGAANNAGGISSLNDPPSPDDIIYYTKLSQISETAEAETAACIIDKKYTAQTVNRSCTIKELDHDILIDAGDNDMIVLLDNASLNNTIRVKAGSGSVTFFINGDLTLGENSRGIIWHEVCDDMILRYDQIFPMKFYGSENSSIILNGENVLCGCFFTTETKLIAYNEGFFKINYISEYCTDINNMSVIKPQILGSALFNSISVNQSTFMVANTFRCYSDTETGNNIKFGDANVDSILDMSDVVTIMLSLANPNKYPLTKQGSINADTNNDGVTVGDALTIQKHLLMM